MKRGYKLPYRTPLPGFFFRLHPSYFILRFPAPSRRSLTHATPRPCITYQILCPRKYQFRPLCRFSHWTPPPSIPPSRRGGGLGFAPSSSVIGFTRSPSPTPTG